MIEEIHGMVDEDDSDAVTKKEYEDALQNYPFTLIGTKLFNQIKDSIQAKDSAPSQNNIGYDLNDLDTDKMIQ